MVRHASMVAHAVWTAAALCSAHAWPATVARHAQVVFLFDMLYGLTLNNLLCANGGTCSLDGGAAV